MYSYFFKQYKYEKVLGEGGSGKVYSATRIEDDLPVAIKRVDIHKLTEFVDDESEPIFIPFEIFAMKRLNGIPGVVRLIDWLVTEEYYFLVMERVGSDLFTMLSNHPEYLDDEKTCKSIMTDLLDIVIACKKRGIVHNDLKLENISVDVLSDQIQVKVFDFGNADFFKKRFVKSFFGTKFLYPPEWLRFKCHRYEDTAVWTLGIILYELSHNSQPFPDDESILNENLPLMDKHPGLIDFLLKCLRHYKRWNLDDLKRHPWLMQE